MNVDENKMFKRTLELVGHGVAVSVRSSGKEYRGKIVNAMFDSFLLQTDGKNVVIRHDDIYYLEPLA